MGYMACIFAALYFLVYYFSRYNISDTTKALEVYTDPDGEQYSKLKDKIRYNSFLSDGITFALSSIAGAALVAFALVPRLFHSPELLRDEALWPQDRQVIFPRYSTSSQIILQASRPQ